MLHSVIRQSVILPETAERLFEMYVDPAQHAAFTGFPVEIGTEPGKLFQAFGGQLSGQILAIERPRLVVQSWRSVKFHADDPDSTLVLIFAPDPASRGQGRIDLVHIDVPDHDHQDVIEGWNKYYWDPWRTYIGNLSK